MKRFSLKLFNALAIIASICACGGRDTAGGISEETEGVVAITDKTIAGVSQKGPFAKGSSVYLKETKADGSLTPTGKEFYATIRNNKGQFKIENINLESQYALLTVEGYYTRESTNMFSSCAISLNAATDLSKRNSTNINLLTHFEYQRILNLVESGATFAKAKAQAEKEIFAAFGYEKPDRTAEDLDITGESKEDRILKNISAMVDKNFHTEYNITPCEEVRDVIDSMARNFADDGTFTQDLTAKIAAYTYAYQQAYQSKDTSNILSRYLNQYEGITCTQDKAGERHRLQKTLSIAKTEHFIYSDTSNKATITSKKYDYVYAICTSNDWQLRTNEDYEDTSNAIEHQVGSVTDSRDGKTYKTTSVTIAGKTYEWMAENLKYAGTSASNVDDNQKGIYTWTEAIAQSNSKIYSQFGKDSIYQGICPENWHIPTSLEWKALIEHVGSPSMLYSKNWDKFYFTGKPLNDIIEFGAEPTFFDWIVPETPSFTPYAHFIAYSLDISVYTQSTNVQSGLYNLDYSGDYIIDNEPLKTSVFYSVLLGSTPRLTEKSDIRPPYLIVSGETYNEYNYLKSMSEHVPEPQWTNEYSWNTIYKIFKSNALNLKVNVRCVKD